MDQRFSRTAVIGFAFAFAMPIALAKAEIKTQTIDYKQGDATLEGYLAYDDTTAARRPGIIVAHEWGGLTAYEKMRSEMLAKLGFVAFAADIYGKGVRPAGTTRTFMWSVAARSPPARPPIRRSPPRR